MANPPPRGTTLEVYDFNGGWHYCHIATRAPWDEDGCDCCADVNARGFQSAEAARAAAKEACACGVCTYLAALEAPTHEG